jgi:hypothetical protein
VPSSVVQDVSLHRDFAGQTRQPPFRFRIFFGTKHGTATFSTRRLANVAMQQMATSFEAAEPARPPGSVSSMKLSAKRTVRK